MVIFACSWIAVGVFGTVVLIVLGRTDRIEDGLFMAGIGAIMLVSYALYRRGLSRRARRQ